MFLLPTCLYTGDGFFCNIHVFIYFFYHLSKSRKANIGSEEMVQQLKVPAGPTLDLNLVLSTQVG